MILTNLKLFNFRNYREAEVQFRAGTNVLYGKNGQGKTNILESIYYLALTKSFRSSSDQNLILNKERFFRIQGDLSTVQGRQNTVTMAYSLDEGKRLLYNREKVQRFADYIGHLPLVLLAPSDLQISQGGPYLRRQFLDIMLSQASQLYLHHLLQYRRALKQRNSLLQEDLKDENLLKSWEAALIEHGCAIIQKRTESIEILDKMVKEHYQQLSGGFDKVKIVYQSPVASKSSENLERDYQQALDENHSKDLHLQTTTVGPHRDNMLFLINGKPLRIVGSQGEHKTFVISLKMAEFGYLQNIQREAPILLFDDIFGELDAERIKNMIGSLNQIGQVFITTTSPNFFGKVNGWEQNVSFFEIINGNIEPQEQI